MTPVEAITNGREILDPVMFSHGFTFEACTFGKGGSGGPAATGVYARGNRRLDFSYRWAPGAVEYSIGKDTLSHLAYMRFLGKYRESKFLSFYREEPMTGFVALRDDLVAFCQDFLAGNGDEFRRFAAELRLLDGRLPPFLP